MKRFGPLLFAAALTGCATARPADPSAPPTFPSLRAPVIEQPWWFRAPNARFCYCLFGVVMVPQGQLGRYTTKPLPSAEEALLEHEQVHADRQAAMGPAEFEARYATSAAFRWAEESRGYEVQIRFLQSRGVWTTPAQWLPLLLDPSYRGMVSEAEARAWLGHVCAPSVPAQVLSALRAASLDATDGVEITGG